MDGNGNDATDSLLRSITPTFSSLEVGGGEGGEEGGVRGRLAVELAR